MLCNGINLRTRLYILVKKKWMRLRKMNHPINIRKKMKHVPGYIIHGRMDVVCDVNESIQLHKLLPKSKLHIVNWEGHGGKEQHLVYKDIVTKLATKHKPFQKILTK